MSEPLARVLLVEDDPVGRAFMVEALQGMPAMLVAAADCGDAISASRSGPWALALLDLNLPDGKGSELLTQLRAAGPVAAAVALTADPEAKLDARLRIAGFDAVVHKPLSVAALRRLVGERIGSAGGPADARTVGEPSPPGDSAPAPDAVLRDWDDAAALVAAGGHAAIVEALRGLLRADLPGQCAAVRDAVAAGAYDAARAVLHRMRAACGFCGAVALEAAVAALDRALLDGSDADGALRDFEACCARLCERDAAPVTGARAEGAPAA